MLNFDIYFAGKLLPDADPQAVRQALGGLFKLQGKALDKLFSGKPVRVKSSVDVETANRYRKAFRNAGALVDIVAEGQQPAAANTPSAPAMAQETTPDTEPVSSSTAPSVSTEASAAPPATEPGMSLLPPRTGTLKDCQPTIQAKVIPDISWMELDVPGTELAEQSASEPAAVQVPDLDLSAPNTGTLEDCVAEKPAQPIPDISQMSAAPPNTGSLEDCVARKPAQPIPDISHLSIEIADESP